MDFLNTCGQKRCAGKNLEQDKAATTRNIKTQRVKKMGEIVQILLCRISTSQFIWAGSCVSELYRVKSKVKIFSTKIFYSSLYFQ